MYYTRLDRHKIRGAVRYSCQPGVVDCFGGLMLQPPMFTFRGAICKFMFDNRCFQNTSTIIGIVDMYVLIQVSFKSRSNNKQQHQHNTTTNTKQHMQFQAFELMII